MTGSHQWHRLAGAALSIATLMSCVAMSPASFATESTGDIPIDAAHFPDKGLRTCISNPEMGDPIDVDGNGVLSIAERMAVTKISCSDTTKSDLSRGLEWFPNLTELWVSAPSSLDVSKNPNLKSLDATGGNLTSIDVSHNPQLERLDVSDDLLTSLDVSKNPKLAELGVKNNKLTSLDVSHNPKLNDLDVSDNKITSIDVSHNPALAYLDLDNDPLTSLDVSHNTQLESLDAGNPALASINVSKNPKLTHLFVPFSALTSIDLSGASALEALQVGGNKLQNLDVSKNPQLTWLDAGGNKLSHLDLTKNLKLDYLSVGDNELQSLDLSKNSALTLLYASHNKLTSINVSNSAALTNLEVADSELSSIDISHNPELIWLDVDNNKLRSLNTTRNPKLYVIKAENNALTAVDLSKNEKLTPVPVNSSTRSAAFASGAYLDGNPLVALKFPASYQGALGQNSDIKPAVYQASYDGSTFDLSSVASWFDGTKVRDLKGAKLEGAKLTGLSGTTEVTYTYDTGAAKAPLKAHLKLTRLGDTQLSFKDVDARTPHADDIKWLASTGISTGWKEADGSTTFRGMSSVKRQDMAAFLYRLAGSPSFDPSKAQIGFRDVTPDTPHYKEIMWLASTGISTGWFIQGTGKGGYLEFRGMSTVKRQDMAAFLHRLANYEKANPTLGKGVPFTDVNAKTPHADDIAWLAKTGVTTGWAEKDGSTSFRGMSSVKRQDMAAFLHRMKTNVLK